MGSMMDKVMPCGSKYVEAWLEGRKREQGDQEE